MQVSEDEVLYQAVVELIAAAAAIAAAVVQERSRDATSAGPRPTNDQPPRAPARRKRRSK